MNALYIVQSRTRDRFGVWGDWCSGGIGDNAPRTREECERDCVELPGLGAEWGEAEYRVAEARP